MIKGALRVARPLVNYQSSRGLALKDIVTADTIKSIQQATAPFRKAALVELTPPTPAELPKAFRDGLKLFTKSNWKNVTVREAWLNTLVTTEVICWFFVGEVIGKGTLIGYQV